METVIKKEKLTQEEIDARLAEAAKKRRKPRKHLSLPRGTKVSYFRNFKNPNQVLTIVRKFDKASKTVEFGFSVNHAPSNLQSVVVDKTANSVTFSYKKVPGDLFSRKEGRTLALERLQSGGLKAHVVGNEFPVAACLRLLSESLPTSSSAKALAEFWYKSFPERTGTALTKTPPPAQPSKSFLDVLMDFFRGK